MDGGRSTKLEFYVIFLFNLFSYFQSLEKEVMQLRGKLLQEGSLKEVHNLSYFLFLLFNIDICHFCFGQLFEKKNSKKQEDNIKLFKNTF